ncbi:hypothetical protein AAG906_035903 [Vitis piasezkii]
MTTPNGTPILPTTNESQLLTINTTAQAPLKLTSSNYLSWKIQFETLFIGYDLLGYIDGSKPCPPKTLTTNNIRQDQLILNALIGSLSPTIISFIAHANTSHEAWTILANTYAKPSRGRIKQVKNLLKNPSKGTMTVTDFLHYVKARTDELAILGALMEEEDLTEKILDGLGDEYKELVRPDQARDTSISFDELHEKLLSFESSLLANTKSERPNHSNSPGNSGWRPPATFPTHPPMATHSRTPSRTNHPPPRPYQGFCQICGIQGHTAKRCPSFQLVPVQSSTTSARPPANFGASHHVTTDLNNLSLHAQYIGSNDVMIGDGTGLLISHTGSASLPSSTTTFTLNDVLCDLRTGAILLTGNTKDGVYEWPAAQPASSPILAFSHYDALVRNGTWELVPPEDITNLVVCKWIFCIKINSDGSIDRYKARLVAKGFHQRPGVDYHETFSPVVKPTIVRLVLSITVSNGWSLCQLDVNNAFLQGRLSKNFVDYLAQRFSLKDLGPLSYFLGVEVVPHRLGILISQRRYIQDLLKWTNMADAKPVLTSLPTSSTTISLTSSTPLLDPTPYRAAVGSLQYLSLTRPNISFAVNRMAQFMHQPTSEHWVLVKRILHYLCGTLDKGLLLYRDSPLTLHGFSDYLHAFSDADWAGNKDDYSSTSAYLVYLGRNLVSWSLKKQQTIACSSTEAEYRSIAATAAELRWVGSLLLELGISLTTSPVVYCDNVGATQLSSNPIFHSRMKYVATDYHFIRDQVQSSLL